MARLQAVNASAKFIRAVARHAEVSLVIPSAVSALHILQCSKRLLLLSIQS